MSIKRTLNHTVRKLSRLITAFTLCICLLYICLEISNITKGNYEKDITETTTSYPGGPHISTSYPGGPPIEKHVIINTQDKDDNIIDKDLSKKEITQDGQDTSKDISNGTDNRNNKQQNKNKLQADDLEVKKVKYVKKFSREQLISNLTLKESDWPYNMTELPGSTLAPQGDNVEHDDNTQNTTIRPKDDTIQKDGPSQDTQVTSHSTKEPYNEHNVRFENDIDDNAVDEDMPTQDNTTPTDGTDDRVQNHIKDQKNKGNNEELNKEDNNTVYSNHNFTKDMVNQADDKNDTNDQENTIIPDNQSKNQTTDDIILRQDVSDLDYVETENTGQNDELTIEDAMNENTDVDYGTNEEQNLDDNAEFNDFSNDDYTALFGNESENLIDNEINIPNEDDALQYETILNQSDEITSDINQVYGNEEEHLEQAKTSIHSQIRSKRTVLPNRISPLAYWVFKYYEQNIKYNCTKHVVYKCDRELVCGGWSDRMDGVLTGLLWAILTDRCFHIEYDQPCQLYELMETPHTVQLIDDPNNGNDVDGSNVNNEYEGKESDSLNLENFLMTINTVTEHDMDGYSIKVTDQPTRNNVSNTTGKDYKEDTKSANISINIPIKDTEWFPVLETDENKLINWEGIDWNAEVDLENQTSVLLNFVQDSQNPIHKVKHMFANLETSLDEKYPEDVIFIKNNSPLYNYISQSPFYRGKLKQMKMNPDKYDSKLFITDMYNGLFTLKQPINMMLGGFLKDLDQSQLICAQIRVPDIVVKFSYMFNDNVQRYINNISNIWTFLENYPKQNDYRIFVTTNSEEVRNASKFQFGDKTIDVGGKTMHIDQPNPFERLGCESHAKVIVDFEILAYCDVLIITEDSGFGRMASLRRVNKDHLYVAYYKNDTCTVEKKII